MMVTGVEHFFRNGLSFFITTPFMVISGEEDRLANGPGEKREYIYIRF
jgi:hypothetical protein